MQRELQGVLQMVTWGDEWMMNGGTRRRIKMWLVKLGDRSLPCTLRWVCSWHTSVPAVSTVLCTNSHQFSVKCGRQHSAPFICWKWQHCVIYYFSCCKSQCWFVLCRLQNIQVVFLLLGIAMGLFAIVLLLFGFLSTGLTRENICDGTMCVRSGLSCAVLVSSRICRVIVCAKQEIENAVWLKMPNVSVEMPLGNHAVCLSVCCQLTVVTYVVSGAWVGMTTFCALPIVVFLMLSSICQNEIQLRDYWYLDNYCINMTRFGPSHTLHLLLFADIDNFIL